MAANRLSWIVSGVVVLVVGVLVVRTLQRDTATRASAESRPAPAPGSSRPPHPAGSDTAKSAAPEVKVSSVEKAKMVLKQRGFYDGPIDGNYDPPMIESLKRFQAASGMKPTGYLDMKTYTALGIEMGRHGS